VSKPMLLVAILAVAQTLAAAPLVDQQRTLLDLGGTWQASPIEGIAFSYPPRADAVWRDATVPEGEGGVFKDQNPYCPGAAALIAKDGVSLVKTTGIAAWYKRSFDAPATPESCGRIMLRFGGAAFKSEVWLNGQKLGTCLNGLTPFEYDVTAILKPGAANELLVGLASREALLDIPNKSFLYPASGVGAGLWGKVELVYLPKVYFEDLFVKTSVKNKRLVLDATIVNTTKEARSVELSATVRDNQAGTALTSLGPLKVELAPGETKTVELAKDWIAPELWSPGNPALLWAEAKLADSAGDLDHQRVRFGFREFEIRGHDFYLNGVRTTLFRNSWLTTIPASRFQAFEEARATVDHPYNCFRFHIGFNCEAALGICDELGIMAIPESSWHNGLDDKYPLAKADVWLPGAVAYTKALLKHHRNHPSVIIWSLTNESIWAHTEPPYMRVADALAAAAKEADPTRPTQGDGENSWGGRLSVINIHYPESSVENALRARYPNSGFVFPNDCHWLKKDQMNGSWCANFKWDRPLVLGEYWYPSGDPESKTSFMGESVYDWEKWGLQSMAGRDGRRDSEFYQATQMITDAYRIDGVAGLNPWACGNENLMLAVNVRPVDFFPNLPAGQTAVRKFVVFNDTLKGIPQSQLRCRLTSLDGQLLWEKIVSAPSDPGTTKIFDVPIACPDTKTITPALLSVQLCQDRGGWAQRALHEERVFIVPSASLADLGEGVAVLDADGKTVAALASLGLKAKRLQAPTNADLAAVKVLVVGEKTDPAPFKDVINEFVKAGGVVVVLRQEGTKPLSYELPELDPAHLTTRSWTRSYDHPILKGLDDKQFSYWRPDHLVAFNSYNKPSNGPAKTLLDAGGRYGLRWSPLLEVPSGKGAYILSQLYLVDKLGVEPLAGTMLERIVRHAATRGARAVPPPLRLLAGDNKDAAVALAEAGVVTAAGLEGDGPVFVDASCDLSAATLETLKRRLADGGEVWLHGFDSKTVGKVAPLLPFKPVLVPADPKVFIAIRRSSDPLMDNLSSFDFCWARVNLETRWNYFENSLATAKLGAETLRLPTLDVATALTSPAFLVKIPVGKGTILFDTLAWDKALGSESERVARIVASLSANLGAQVRIRRDETPFDYFQVDLAPYANLGFHDKVADDGVGGWTDQGQNDMRFFLINHSGKGGGRDDGMEVEAETFPAMVTLLDRPFKIPDPRQNHGKSLISLRGEMHGVKLPSKVEGVKVGAKADRLWMLQAAGWTPPRADMEVGRYVVHYADGSTVTIPVRFNLEVSDWWNPQPLSNAKVAWTGRNLVQSPIGFYLMEWRNPSPDKVISTIDVVGDLAPTQFVCLGISGGVERGKEAAALRFELPGSLTPGNPAPVPVKVDGVPGLRFKDGSSAEASAKACGDVFTGPFALKVKLLLDAPPTGYMGGVFERFGYMASGFRLVVYKDLRVGVEINAVKGEPVYVVSAAPLQAGRWYELELRFDGSYAVLSIDGKMSGMVATAPPLPQDSGFRVGVAGGKDYFFNGVLSWIELRKLK